MFDIKSYPNLTFITSISMKNVLNMAYPIAREQLNQNHEISDLIYPSLAPTEIKFAGS